VYMCWEGEKGEHAANFRCLVDPILSLIWASFQSNISPPLSHFVISIFIPIVEIGIYGTLMFQESEYLRNNVLARLYRS
jgi:hypothetical protein